jgi:hypothetical protein
MSAKPTIVEKTTPPLGRRNRSLFTAQQILMTNDRNGSKTGKARIEQNSSA